MHVCEDHYDIFTLSFLIKYIGGNEFHMSYIYLCSQCLNCNTNSNSNSKSVVENDQIMCHVLHHYIFIILSLR